MEVSRRKIGKLGSFEAEISYEGEGGLHNCFIFCEKNPEHKDFIPIKDFNCSHLPPQYQDKIIEDVIKALADITVRVSVTQISANRPPVFPGTGEPYPFYNDREKSHVMATGTGRVFRVDIFTESNKQNCPCETCKLSTNPETEWGMVYIHTANHVVFDEFEAEHTICQLFDDVTEDRSVLELQGMKMVKSFITDDTCHLTYTTHEMDVVNKLAGLVQRFFHAHCKAHSKYIDNWYSKHRPPQIPEAAVQRLNVMVSYCQGLTKKVLLESANMDTSQLVENTPEEPTCSQSNNNKSSKMTIVPVSELSIDHLPQHYQDNDIMDFIHSLSDLTVKLSVSCISKNRPEKYPGTNQPSPSHDSTSSTKSTEEVITGSGTAVRVVKYTADDDIRCECEECQLSSSPRKEWGFVLILTSRDVVYDATEAAHTTCLFLEDKLGSNSELALKGMTLDTKFTDCENGSCELFYIAHDMHVLDKLISLRLRVLELYRKIQNKFSDSRYIGLRSPGTRDFTQRLAVIVSHPHGRRKHVTVGEWTERRIMGRWNDGELTEYTYTTPTCRGSSGASIFTLGRFLYTSHHPHSRGLLGNINTSATIGDM